MVDHTKLKKPAQEEVDEVNSLLIISPCSFIDLQIR